MIHEKLTKEILEVNQLKDKNFNNVKIILMYNFVKIALDEIVENMNSENYYQIKFLTILIEKIYQWQHLKKKSYILFNLSLVSVSEFLEIYK